MTDGDRKGRHRRGIRKAAAERRMAIAASAAAQTVDKALDKAIDEEDLALAEVDCATQSARSDKSLIIACGALAREILAICEINNLHHIQLRCLPATLHNRPDAIPDRLRSALERAKREGWGHIFVGYADCGTGGLIDKVCEAFAVPRIAGPHCYAFFDGLRAFDARHDAERGAFYLTDFLVNQFETLIWRGLGLHKAPELRDVYFGNYDRVVYLAQTDNPKLDADAQCAAQLLDLAYEKRFTGYGGLEDFLLEPNNLRASSNEIFAERRK
jgi:hypothetical protein